ncbi:MULTISPECIES: ABC transporter substrate-binding protein [Rubrivivax]|uniref:ABC transporter substrate-binding protein n=1 Tax=Rubrivivax benzoatilyticus TaxID=316997 RepID=A0ABX0HRA7_9BURK|nr:MULTISPECIES: helical backbone metal receptor [Rubrivivax]MCD0418249.1 helical backbone metal receptor [Rubrivivax sp. JA1024]EGJ11130.1 Iron(III) dicitrate-binding protein [Rubrivivax benzoatilyticus JA2 = ATCC BAA-35]MCC9595998.1 helical backbone metal receptor [Rubrivivax sp. JA1055]NHK97595.1 ABC transporter substrate-binding protein [Rubrivivax benzoatilyticus]NHL22710.1 ABC transporter substrate-binding protein [Rubrivivax benzoatilyticus]
MKPVRRLLLLLALCAGAATAAEPPRDDRGVAWQGGPPQRIVSLLPSLTETVCALGACARLVGVDRYSDWPAQVNALPRLGGLDDASVERIVALRPELVLAARSARVAERLEALGLKVMVFDSDSHAQVRHSTDALARVLGQPQRAAQLWASIHRDEAAAAARIPPRLRGRSVYFEVDSTPYAAGPGSFIGETLQRLGLRNVVPAEYGAFPRLNPEFLVRKSPDLVMAEDRALATMAERPGWHTLRALKDGQACGFERERYLLLIRPGPRMGEAALAIADCLAGLPEK